MKLVIGIFPQLFSEMRQWQHFLSNLWYGVLTPLPLFLVLWFSYSLSPLKIFSTLWEELLGPNSHSGRIIKCLEVYSPLTLTHGQFMSDIEI